MSNPCEPLPEAILTLAHLEATVKHFGFRIHDCIAGFGNVSLIVMHDEIDLYPSLVHEAYDKLTDRIQRCSMLGVLWSISLGRLK